MSPSTEEFIDLLNSDLRQEYMAVVQYTQHFGMLCPRGDASLSEQIQNLAGDELAHALILAEQVRILGGHPEVCTPRAQSSEDPANLLEQDIQGEEDAIVRYQERIAQAEGLGLETTAQILRLILAVEERHLRILHQLMGQFSS